MKYLPLVLMMLFPFGLIAQSETLHEGKVEEGKYIGIQRWYIEDGRKVAEVIYDDEGNLESYRTWTDEGSLMDDEEASSQRKRKDLPELDFAYDEDGFGIFLLPAIHSENEPTPLTGDKVSIRYEGTLQDGTIFDSNINGKVFRFKYNMEEVIPGFDRAVSNLRVGDSGYFYIPWKLAYGDQAAGTIPPYSNLIFQITLEDLNSAGKRR
jgi:FKBP-type peptidyl-prolyl cis-trans isomerase